MEMSKTKSAWPEYDDTKGWIIRGLQDGAPIAMGYFAVSFALGITAKEAGINALQGSLMSIGMVASAGEYAAIMLIGAGAGIAEMILTTLVINLRYFLMSCSLTQKLREDVPLWKRFVLAYCVTDELFGISSAVPGYLNPVFTWAAAFISVVGWTLGTALGVIAGNILPDQLISALSVALYGMFLAIIIPPSKKSRFMAGLVMVSMLSSWLFTASPVFSGISSGFRVIILTIIIAGIAAVIRPVDDKGQPVKQVRKVR